MPDILIRGMNFPTSCDVCPFVGTNDDLQSDDYRYLYCGFPYMGEFVTDYEKSRHPDCPLHELPPHGDLIDRDEYVKSECNNCDGSCECVECDCLNCEQSCRCDVIVDAMEAPAVIPADKEAIDAD